MMRNWLALALGCAAIGTPGALSAENLGDVLGLTYRTNPTIRAARADYEAVEQATAQAWANALPQISATASIEEAETAAGFAFAGDGAAGDDFVSFSPRTYGVSAEQAIFTGFRNFNAIRQARARVKAGGAQLANAEQQVLLSAASAYFDVLRDVTVYDANLSNVNVLLRQQQLEALRFDVGEATKTDVAQADARLAGARAQLASAQAQLAVSRAAFREVVGEPAGTLDPSPMAPSLPETLDEAVRIAANYAPPVIAARQTAEISRRQVAIARGALAPSISLTTSYQFAEEPNVFTSDSEDFRYGARASLPIFRGGLNYARIKEAKAASRADQQRIEEALRRTDAAVTQAWEQLQAARATIRSAEAQIAANKLALTGVRRESEVGARTTLDVLNAEQELLNARVTLANALRDEQVAAFTLLSSMGVLTVDAVSDQARAQ